MIKTIAIYSKFSETILEMLPSDTAPYIIESDDISNELLDTLIKFKIFIMDSSVILNSHFNIFNIISTHKIFNDLPILVYSKSDTFEEKNRLYSRGINGIITDTMDKDSLENLINRVILKSNSDIGSLKHRFIKSFTLYEGFEESVNDALYLGNYIIYTHKLKGVEAEIVKDTVSLLIIAYKNADNLSLS